MLHSKRVAKVVMKSLNISVISREARGRHAVNRLRAQGIIPAVIYGKSGTRLLGVKSKDFYALLKAKGTGTAIVEVEDEKRKKMLATIAQIQKDVISDEWMHIDFKEVAEDEASVFAIPVVMKGEAVGVKTENATLEILRHEISIRCLLRDIVDSIEIDISHLHAGERIHVKDLPVLPGISYLGDPEVVVVSCSKPVEEEAKPSETDKAATESEG